MNTSQKLLDQMLHNPIGWQIAQLKAVAQQYNIVWRQPGTSHCVFVRNDGSIFVVPTHKPIKPVYVKNFLKFVKGVQKDAQS